MDHLAGERGNYPDACYANYFEIGNNEHEFVIDFGQFHQGNGQPRFSFRLVTGPAYARELSVLLQESIREYEEAYGSIPFDEKR